jgi:hypothetical protein
VLLGYEERRAELAEPVWPRIGYLLDQYVSRGHRDLTFFFFDLEAKMKWLVMRMCNSGG